MPYFSVRHWGFVPPTCEAPTIRLTTSVQLGSITEAEQANPAYRREARLTLILTVPQTSRCQRGIRRTGDCPAVRHRPFALIARICSTLSIARVAGREPAEFARGLGVEASGLR